MSNVETLKNNVELYKKLKTEADKKVSEAINRAEANRQEQKVRPTRPS